MRTIDDLFIVRNGVPTTDLVLSRSKVGDMVAFLRPSSSQARSLAGYVDRAAFKAVNIHDAETLYVSTNGEGSHSYAYVSPVEFACNSDVSVLIPRAEMNLTEKIFYAHCVTMNRFRFSYGRKPKGSRLKEIEVPDFPKKWDLAVPTLTWS